MSHEQSPREQPPIHTLDNLVGESGKYFVIAQMQGYVQDLMTRTDEKFPTDEERIGQYGALLVQRLTQPPITPYRIEGFTRCLRFGLRLSQFIAGDEAYVAALDGYELLFLQTPDEVKERINSSYFRYLHHQEYLQPTLQDTLLPIAPATQQVTGRNIISFTLELADNYVYSRQLAEGFDEDLTRLLSPPDNEEKRE